MKLSIIVACAENNVIGVNNGLPWSLSEDLKYFKQRTMGKPMIMGRKTFDSIGRPLPGRTTLVVTRQQNWSHSGVVTCSSLDDALEKATHYISAAQQEVMVVGGEHVYSQCIDKADTIYLTQVAVHVDGDAFFPELQQSDWQRTVDFSGVSAASNINYSFITLRRR